MLGKREKWFGAILCGVIFVIPLKSQFFQEENQNPSPDTHNYRLYQDLNNRFYYSNDEFHRSDNPYSEGNDQENYAFDDDIQDPPIDDDPPVPIGRFWEYLMLGTGVFLGMYLVYRNSLR